MSGYASSMTCLGSMREEQESVFGQLPQIVGQSWAVSVSLHIIRLNAANVSVGGLLAESGQWVAYHVTILYSSLLLVQCVLLPETLYPRAIMVTAERQGTVVDVKRTNQLGHFVSCEHNTATVADERSAFGQSPWCSTPRSMDYHYTIREALCLSNNRDQRLRLLLPPILVVRR